MKAPSCNRVTDMKSLAAALNSAQEGTGEVKHVLSTATFCPRLPGLTKMISKLTKEGSFRKGLEVYESLPDLGIAYDTTITNAAISACDKGNQWQCAMRLFQEMPEKRLMPDAITYSSVISALAKGKQWALALKVFDNMQARGVEADVVTCCSLISALERGGQWQLAEQLFLQMCAASSASGPGPLRALAHRVEMQQPQLLEQASPVSTRRDSGMSFQSDMTDYIPALEALVGTPLRRGSDGTMRSSCDSDSTITPDNMSPRAAGMLGDSLEAVLLGGQYSGAASWLGGALPGLEILPHQASSSHGSPLSEQSGSTGAEWSPAGTRERSPSSMFASLASGASQRAQEAKRRLLGEGTPPKDLPPEKQSEGAVAAPPADSSPKAKATAVQRSMPLRTYTTALESIMEATTQGPPATPGSRQVEQLRPGCTAQAKADDRLPAGAVGKSESFEVASTIREQLRLSAISTSASVTPEVRGEGGMLVSYESYEAGVDGAGRATSLTVPRLKHMNVSRIAPNRVCCNALLAAFARARPAQWQKALTLLDAMTEAGGEVSPDVVSFNTCLKACGSAGRLEHALQVYRKMMQQGVWPSITTFGTLLTATSHAGSYETVKQVWQWLLESGLEISSACIHAYVSALAKGGNWEEARAVLQSTLGRRAPGCGKHVGSPTAVHGNNGMRPLQTSKPFLQQAASGPMAAMGLADTRSLLVQLAQMAVTAGPQDLVLLASEAMTAFQQLAAQGPSVPGVAFASLLCVLACADQWETAFCIYELVLVQEVIASAVVSSLVARHAAAGQLPWALHYWLAQRQKGAPLPSLQAHQALLAVCRSKGAWKPALHILHCMLASPVAPDEQCFEAVLHTLAHAGLAVETAQELVHMLQSGMQPSVGLLTDVLSLATLTFTRANLQALVQAMGSMGGCGLREAGKVAQVVQGLPQAALPQLALALLNCLPTGADERGDVHWALIGRLLLFRHTPAAVQVCFQGHMVGSMQYYKPHRPQGPEGEEPLVHLDASGLGVDSGLMVLLAWLCAMCQAQVQGVQLRATTVKVLFGASGQGRDRQREEVHRTLRSVLAPSQEGGWPHMLVGFSLPPNRTIADSLAQLSEDGVALLPLSELLTWLPHAHMLVQALLTPL